MAREGWNVVIYLKSECIIRAKLSVGRAPVEALDHHRRPSKNETGVQVPAGYHWDVFYPLVRKEPVSPQPTGRESVLAALVHRWHLELDPTVQQELLR